MWNSDCSSHSLIMRSGIRFSSIKIEVHFMTIHLKQPNSPHSIITTPNSRHNTQKSQPGKKTWSLYHKLLLSLSSFLLLPYYPLRPPYLATLHFIQNGVNHTSSSSFPSKNSFGWAFVFSTMSLVFLFFYFTLQYLISLLPLFLH